VSLENYGRPEDLTMRGAPSRMKSLTNSEKLHMSIKHILLYNSELGKLSKEQRADHLKVWQTSLHNPNFTKYAKN